MLASGGRTRIIPRVKAILLALGLVLSAGCAMPTDRALYEIALAGAKSGADVPSDAEWLGFEAGAVMPLKNMTRVNVAYSSKGPDGAKKQTYCTVWLKRVALTWVVDRCVPPKNPAPQAPTASDAR